jgi:hypothetical protein
MPLPTVADVHVDSLRTEMSVMYIQDEDSFVAQAGAPLLTVDKQSDKYAVWSKADYMRRQMRKIADGDPAPKMGFAVDTSNTFYCHTYGGKKFLSDRQRANYDTPLKADQASVKFVTQQGLIERDTAFAAAAWTTGVWGTDKTPTTEWDATNGDPIGDIRVGIRTIKRSTGRKPNTLIMGADVWDTIQDHADFTDRIKYTREAVVTEDLVARVFGLKNVRVADAVYNSAGAGATATMAEIFDPDDALLLYVADSPSHDEPSALYTFSWAEFDGIKGTGAAAIKTWREDDPDGEFFRGMMSFDVKVVASDCGYFFRTAV